MNSAINCKFKMKAIASVEHAGVKYAPGATFEVHSVESRQFVIDHQVAVDDTTDVATTLEAPTPVQLEKTTTKVPHGTTTKRIKRGN